MESQNCPDVFAGLTRGGKDANKGKNDRLFTSVAVAGGLKKMFFSLEDMVGFAFVLYFFPTLSISPSCDLTDVTSRVLLQMNLQRDGC